MKKFIFTLGLILSLTMFMTEKAHATTYYLNGDLDVPLLIPTDFDPCGSPSVISRGFYTVYFMDGIAYRLTVNYAAWKNAGKPSEIKFRCSYSGIISVFLYDGGGSIPNPDPKPIKPLPIRTCDEDDYYLVIP